MAVRNNPKNQQKKKDTAKTANPNAVNIAGQNKERKEFYIEYNPYINETKFLFDGKNAKGLFETYSRDFRLQQYLEEREGWKGLFSEIVNKCNSRNIKVVFKGREMDFDDLRLCLDESEYKDSIELEYIPAKNDNDLIKDIGELIEDLRHMNIDELKNNERVDSAYKEALKAQLKVSVIATMSSGKSTLINSLLGNELLPSQNEACTATVARILDNDDMDHFSCICKNKDEKELTRKDNVAKTDLEEFNLQGKEMDNDDPHKIIFMDMEGPIPGISSEKIRLLLQDTPGPNNSRDAKHKELTEDMIKDKKNSVILYVMNATQLRVDDDYKLLNLVSTAMKSGGKQTRDRFIFVVNKFDALDLEKEDPYATIKETKKYLHEFGIENPNVFPVSAYAALLIRKKLSGQELTRKEGKDVANYLTDFGDEDFEQAHFEKMADISPYVRKMLAQRLGTADENERALIHTGIPAIEETINEYLEKYAYPIKVNDAVNEIQRTVRELDMVRRFNESIVSDKETRDRLKLQVEAAKRKQKEAEAHKISFAQKINAFSLDESSKKPMLRTINEGINDVINEFGYETKVPEREARSKLNSFTHSVNSIQDKYESQLKSIIENELKAKGERMSAEYSTVVSKLFSDIHIDGFDFSSIKAVDDFRIADMDALIRKNGHVEDITETRTIDNPERSGFWGKFKFWKPKYVETTVVIGQETYVNVREIVVGECGFAETMFTNNVNDAYRKAVNEIKAYKMVFNRNLTKLSSKIDVIIQDMDDKLNNVAALEEEISRNREKLSDIEKTTNKIGRIMEF